MSNRLDGPDIYRRIPHAGAMCLLAAVREWDASGIVCTAHSHAQADHPLREDGRLSSMHAIEYAAQAAALHASLTGETVETGEARALRRAYIAALHAVELCSHSLDHDEMIRSPLEIRAQLTAAGVTAARYGFSVVCGAVCIARGTMTVAMPE
ncbi:MAG: 3-hydroxylacyl-ACP dehydratase [Trinickia sp.]|uniref:3-hydroxylacyl-ACP dehydratase n=1 Tax=Trinickia sp. TaxID=2571163 RepID=UPI003F812054